MYGDKTLSIVMPIVICYLIYYIIWTSITKRQNADDRGDRSKSRSVPAKSRRPIERQTHRRLVTCRRSRWPRRADPIAIPPPPLHVA